MGTNYHSWHPLFMYQIELNRTGVHIGFLIYCVYIRNNSRLVYHLFSSCWHKHDFVFSLKRDGSLRPVYCCVTIRLHFQNIRLLKWDLKQIHHLQFFILDLSLVL